MGSKISFFHSEGMRAFGFYSKRFSDPSNPPPGGGIDMNILQACSYIPVIEALMGSVKIYAVFDSLRANEEFSIYHKAVLIRGSMEVLAPVGAFFLGYHCVEGSVIASLLLIGIPDLIVTFGRMLSPHPRSAWGRTCSVTYI